MSDETVGIVSILALVFLVSSCDSVKLPPKLIEADGQTYLACSGLVWTGTEGGGLLGNGSVLKVSFTDAEGLNHKIMGIKSLTVSDIPKMEDAPMPPMSWWPDPSGKDRDGKPFVEGVPYDWDGGYSMTLKNGQWVPTKRYNTSCESAEKKAELQAGMRARKSLDEIFKSSSSSSVSTSSNPYANLSDEQLLKQLYGTAAPVEATSATSTTNTNDRQYSDAEINALVSKYHDPDKKYSEQEVKKALNQYVGKDQAKK